MTGQRIKQTFRLTPALSKQLADYARSKRVSQAAVAEAALTSFLSPDDADRLEAAVSRRLDRIGRSQERLEWNVTLCNETLALFVRHWLSSIPPLQDTMQAAARALGRERWERFIEALGRKMEAGPSLANDLLKLIEKPPSPRD